MVLSSVIVFSTISAPNATAAISISHPGEWSLKAIIQDIFPENKYRENEEIIEGSGKRVEFVIILPGGLLQPIDAKFPSGLYDNYLEASSKGDKEKVKSSKKDIERHVKSDAEDIKSKYLLTGKT